jgi:hypothetical protein
MWLALSELYNAKVEEGGAEIIDGIFRGILC